MNRLDCMAVTDLTVGSDASATTVATANIADVSMGTAEDGTANNEDVSVDTSMDTEVGTANSEDVPMDTSIKTTAIN